MRSNNYKTQTIGKFVLCILDNPKDITYTVTKRKHHIIVLFLSKTIHSRVHIELVVSGSHVQIIGFVIGQGKNTISLHTLQNHKKKDTTSNLLIKSVLQESSAFRYEGTIQVDKNAQKTDAYQRNDNLLLSSDAYAECSPKLEILANDVRCTHGATITSVDETQLLYLKTRGIPTQTGRLLIANGFMKSLFEKITDPDVYACIEKEYRKHIRIY